MVNKSYLYITLFISYMQCCDLETMFSKPECTRVHFVQVSVSVSRPDGQGFGLGLDT